MNIKPKTVKLLEENTGKKILQPWVRQNFLDMPKAQSIEKKIINLTLSKLKIALGLFLAVHWLRLNASYSTWNSAQ